MRYIFFGTPEFAAIILEKLIAAGMAPVAVVTNPDRPAGRKHVLTAGAVKRFMIQDSRLHQDYGGQARFKNTVLFQPDNLNALCSTLNALQPEVGILAAYGQIIPREIINVFPKGIVVVHPSLLPAYRGPTPIQSAILNGDTETGTTLFLMDEKIDHGPILGFRVEGSLLRRGLLPAGRQVGGQVGFSETYETLIKKLAEASVELLIEIVPRYLRGEIKPQAQDETQATYTKKFTSNDGFVDPVELASALHGAGLTKDPPEKIWRMVRALNPEPGVWTMEGGRRMKLLEADLIQGKLVLRKIQFAGEKPRVV